MPEMQKVVWRVLDREAEVAVSCRQLPHWDQTGAVTFVTFRLADSMPRSVLDRWRAEQLEWLPLVTAANSGKANRSTTSCGAPNSLSICSATLPRTHKWQVSKRANTCFGSGLSDASWITVGRLSESSRPNEITASCDGDGA